MLASKEVGVPQDSKYVYMVFDDPVEKLGFPIVEEGLVHGYLNAGATHFHQVNSLFYGGYKELKEGTPQKNEMKNEGETSYGNNQKTEPENGTGELPIKFMDEELAAASSFDWTDVIDGNDLMEEVLEQNKMFNTYLDKKEGAVG